MGKCFKSDIAFLFFTGIVFVTYQYAQNLSPEFLLFFIQMVLLWFALKVIYRLFPSFKTLVMVGLVLWGVVEAVWGLGQLYGYFPLKHALFKTTGSFLNPGPYGGFIALVLPLTLYSWLTFKLKSKWIGYLFLFAGVLCMMVLPATLSRTAWIAAIAGCLVVLLSDKRIIVKSRLFWRHRKKECIIGVSILSLFLAIAVYGVYYLKKDSADGRLFMWKVTTFAIKESPVKGTGLGGFPAAYANAQMSYFENGKASETEKLVAGSPEYAFNEYLQLFLEQGLIGIVLFLFLSFVIIKEGIKNRQAGAAGSFTALAVFALASYPYQLWQFPVAWVLLGTVCTGVPGKENAGAYRHGWKKIVAYSLLLGLLSLFSIACASRQKTFYRARNEWKKLQPLYNMKAYESMLDEYTGLYSILNHDPKFVFEYGMILNATGQRVEANEVFARGIERSCDPMFYNVKGRNYHEMGEYDRAEECYMKSTRLLPERIYPYYLLTKLYADSANYHPTKMQEAALAVLEKEPKVHSMAINEMRDEVRSLLSQCQPRE